MKTIYTIYCYEDQEIKDVFTSLEKANEWIEENRRGREDIVRIQKWDVKE